MATTRIKDITTAATTFSSDDFVAIDGATSGTRKMAKGDLITEVSSGVSGTYLEESNNLSDVASLDTSKLNMEIPDVGTAPNEVPLNGQLGTMAFQSAEAVSVDKLEVTDKLGVGVNPSGNPLEVAGSNGNFSIAADGNTASFSRNAANYIAATADTSSSLAALAKHSFQVHTGNPTVEALRVDSSQRVGIGGSPSYTLDVKRTDAAGDYLYVGASSDGGQRGLKFTSADNGIYLGAAHTIDAGSSGGSIALSINGTPRCTIDSSGRVGIGTASPGSYYSESDDLVIGDVSGDRGITVVSGTSGTGSLFFADGTSGADAYRGQIRYLHNANQLMFAVNSNEAFRVGSGGDIVMASGNGIDFGATVLSEFEQGIFTVSVAPATSGTLTVDTASDQLAYAIVGDIVTVHGQIALDGASSPVGNYVKINLPAAIALGTLSEDADYSAGSCVVTSAAGNLGDYSLLAEGGDSFVRIYKNTASTFGATAADFNGDESIYISITYRKA